MLSLKHIKFRYFSLLLAGVFLFASIGEAQNFSKKRKELEAKRKELQKQILKNKTELKRVKSQESNSLKELAAITQQIVTRERLIDHVAQETFEISVEIENQRRVIETLKADLAKLKEDYAAYIVAAYMKRDTHAAMLYVLDSKSLNQAFKRVKYLSAYGTYRQRQAQLILNTQKEMISALENLIDIKREKTGLIHLKETEKRELLGDKKEETQVLGKLQQKVKGLNQTIAEQEKAARKLNQSINDLIAAEIEAARKAEEQKRAKAAQANKPTAPKTNNSYLSSSELKLSNNFAGNKGKLPWPVSGNIIQTFGEHPHPTLKGVVTNNNGIDIGVKPGTQVHPVFDGTVKAVFPIPGMEKVILVNHGEYYTVYACLDHVEVKSGQSVDKNTVLGTIAANAEDGSGKLHFEVWKQRAFQNPAPWLRPR